MPFLYH